MPYTFQTLTTENKDTASHGIGRFHRWTGMIRPGAGLALRAYIAVIEHVQWRWAPLECRSGREVCFCASILAQTKLERGAAGGLPHKVAEQMTF